MRDYVSGAAIRDEVYNIENMVNNLLKDISNAADTYAPKTRGRKKVTPPWWSAELDTARKAMRASARHLSVPGGRREFNFRRNAYKTLLRRSKIASWQAFCTSEGTLPWGKLYRWLKNGTRLPLNIGLMTRPDGTRCNSLEESVDLLLNTLIPNDQHQPDHTRTMETTCDINPIEGESLKDMVWGISPARAPGFDGVTGKMICVLWPALHERLLRLVNLCLEVIG